MGSKNPYNEPRSERTAYERLSAVPVETRPGEMSEWLKEHAWKACIRQSRIGGSNPPLTASN